MSMRNPPNRRTAMVIRRLRGTRKLRKTGLAAVAFVVAVAVMSGCLLKEGEQYQVNDAPPNGVYVNLYTSTTDKIQLLHAQVCHGNVTCTMDWLQANVEFNRGVMGWALNYVWDMSLREREEGDFAEALANASGTDGGAQRCLNLTIRAYGPWPQTDWDYNWSWRPLSDANCR